MLNVPALPESSKQAFRKIYGLVKGTRVRKDHYGTIDNDLTNWSAPRYQNSKKDSNQINIQANYNQVIAVRIVMRSHNREPSGKEGATLAYHLSKIESLESLHIIIDDKFLSKDSDAPTVMRFRLPNLKKFKLEIRESKSPNYHHEIRFEDTMYPNLEYFNLSSFPRNFRNLSNSFFTKFPKLTTLSINMEDPMAMIDSFHFLHDLFDVLDKQVNLANLILYDYFHDLPENISKMTSLRGLSIKNNPKKEVYTLPESFGNLQNLEILDLWRYDLTKFPRILLQLPLLRIIQLVHTEIDCIPAEIERLTHLRDLVLVNSNLTSLPVELAKIGTLAFLDFENNMIKTVPPVFFEKNLKLNLKNNPIENLENKIFGYERIAGGKISANMEYHVEDSKDYQKFASPKAFRRAHRQLLDNF